MGPRNASIHCANQDLITVLALAGAELRDWKTREGIRSIAYCSKLLSMNANLGLITEKHRDKELDPRNVTSSPILWSLYISVSQSVGQDLTLGASPKGDGKIR